MTQRVINNIATVPIQQQQQAVAQGTDTASQQPTTGTPSQPQAQPAQMQGFSAGDMIDIAKQGYDFSKQTGLLSQGTQIAAFTNGGAAAGAVGAGGGTYVTGSGLAGQASAINTTAGAAGKVGTTGSSLSSGLATAGVGIVAGFLGDKLFGGYGGAGSSAGASIGFSVGGVAGAVVGGLIGGVFGGLFGGKKPQFMIAQGTATDKHSKDWKYDTPLGQIEYYAKKIPSGTVSDVLKSIKESDQAVADLMTEEQLARVKKGVASFDSEVHAGKVKSGSAIVNIVQASLKDRYSNAVGGLDKDYKDTFDRVVTDSNMGGLISTFARMDQDIIDKKGVFADFAPNVTKFADFDPNDIRLQRTIAAKNPQAGKLIKNPNPPTGVAGMWGVNQYIKAPDTIQVANPDFDQAMYDQYREYFVTGGYKKNPAYSGMPTIQSIATGAQRPSQWIKTETNISGIIGSEALDHIASKYNMAARPTEPPKVQLSAKDQQRVNSYNARVSAMKRSGMPAGFYGTAGNVSGILAKQAKAQAAQDAAYEKQLGAWEKTVLDAYVNNYQASIAPVSPTIATDGGSLTINRDTGTTGQATTAVVPSSTINSQGMLSQSAQQVNWGGGVNRVRRSQQVSNDSTDAEKLRKQRRIYGVS